MTKRILLFTVLISSFIFFACNDDDDMFKEDYEMSYQTWLKFKASNNNSYKYEVVEMTGQTVITVENGEITQRSFKYATNSEEEVNAWVETGDEIGIHEYAAAPLTLDQIYEKARTEWLIKKNNTNTYFEINNNNLISLCGYMDNWGNFYGIQISYIIPL